MINPFVRHAEISGSPSSTGLICSEHLGKRFVSYHQTMSCANFGSHPGAAEVCLLPRPGRRP